MPVIYSAVENPRAEVSLPRLIAAGANLVMAGGWIADVATHQLGYTVIGALAGAYAGVRIWNRYAEGR